MTKKDYIALAAALKVQKPDIMARAHDAGNDATLYAVAFHQWSHDVMAVMEVLRADNPNFNRNTFANACGVANVMNP